MRRILAVAVAMFAVAAAACSSGGESSSSAVETTTHEPITLTITGEWTGVECDKWKEIFPAFTEAYPWATVDPSAT